MAPPFRGQQSGQGDRYGLGAHPCLRYRDGGSRAAGAERTSGRGKPHPEEPVEWAIEALSRTPSEPCSGGSAIAWAAKPLPRSRLSRGRTPSLPGIASLSPVSSMAQKLVEVGQTAGYPRSRAADRSHGQREPRLGL